MDIRRGRAFAARLLPFDPHLLLLRLHAPASYRFELAHSPKSGFSCPPLSKPKHQVYRSAPNGQRRRIHITHQKQLLIHPSTNINNRCSWAWLVGSLRRLPAPPAAWPALHVLSALPARSPWRLPADSMRSPLCTTRHDITCPLSGWARRPLTPPCDHVRAGYDNGALRACPGPCSLETGSARVLAPSLEPGPSRARRVRCRCSTPSHPALHALLSTRQGSSGRLI